MSPCSFLPGHSPSLPWVRGGRAPLGSPSGCPPSHLPAGTAPSGPAPRGPPGGPPVAQPSLSPCAGGPDVDAHHRGTNWHLLERVPGSIRHLPWALGGLGGLASHLCPSHKENRGSIKGTAEENGAEPALAWLTLAPMGQPCAPRGSPHHSSGGQRGDTGTLSWFGLTCSPRSPFSPRSPWGKEAVGGHGAVPKHGGQVPQPAPPHSPSRRAARPPPAPRPGPAPPGCPACQAPPAARAAPRGPARPQPGLQGPGGRGRLGPLCHLWVLAHRGSLRSPARKKNTQGCQSQDRVRLWGGHPKMHRSELDGKGDTGL